VQSNGHILFVPHLILPGVSYRDAAALITSGSCVVQ
jgi:hypothetical protein